MRSLVPISLIFLAAGRTTSPTRAAAVAEIEL
jgi:hypothetical protein